MIYIVDSYAWIEYFIGSDAGLILKRLLDNKNNKFITLECTISELKCYCLRTGYNFSQVQITLKKDSIILPVSAFNWMKAAEIRHELRKKIKDFGLIDSILAAKQNELKCSLISGDKHFKGMKNVVYIGE